MKHPERVGDYLEHIVQAIDHITSWTHETGSAATLERDQKTQAAVIRYIEIIGEAANRIYRLAPEFIDNHPSLPGHQMRGMRNRMIHNYFVVNIDVLWRTVKNDLPVLKQQINNLLKAHPPEPDRSR